MESKITFSVKLDGDKIPEAISWSATDSGIEGLKPCNATMMCIWDPKDHTTLRIDLWTKEMLVDDMKRFFYENLLSLADTYMRATLDEECAREIKTFANWFGEKTGVVGK